MLPKPTFMLVYCTISFSIVELQINYEGGSVKEAKKSKLTLHMG